MKKIRVGVIGLGMGKSHLRRFAECPQAVVTAVCDLDEGLLAKAKEEYNIPFVFTDYRKMLKLGELDAVSIVTPNVFHAAMSMEALRRGKHVLCEKPMAMNARQAKRMVEEAGKHKKKLMIHFNQRYSPEARYIKNTIDKGGLGEIYYIKTGWLRRMGAPMRPSFTDKSVSGGGPLIDLGVHRLDLALWLLDYPGVLTVSAGVFDKIAGDKLRSRGMKYDVEDLGVAMLRLDTGAVLMLEASWATMIKCEEEMNTVIFGTKGSFEQKSIDYKVVEFKFITETRDKITEVTPKVDRKCGSAQQHFLDCIINDLEPEVSGAHGVDIMKILDGIYKSSKLGREVKIT